MKKYFSYINAFLIVSSLNSCKHKNERASEVAADVATQPSDFKNVSMFDVSILYPFPESATLGMYITSKDNILPKFNFTHRPLNVKELSELMVLGVRLDPCFPGIVQNHGECKPQIRFVMQPIRIGDNTQDDTALHVFFDMSKEKLNTVVQSIMNLRKKYNIQILDSKALQIHPALEAKNMNFARELKTLLLQNVSSAQVSRITSAIGQRGTFWEFEGLDIKSGVQSPIKIAGLEFASSTQSTFSFAGAAIGGNLEGASPQDLVSGAFNPGGTMSGPFGKFEPALKQGAGSDDISYLNSLEDTQVANIVFENNAAELEKIKTDVIAAYRIENPKIHTPDSINCISCHVARQTIQKGAAATLNDDFSQASYQNPLAVNQDMQYQFSINFANMRAFGYIFSAPTISQRTINETIEVVKYFRQSQSQ